MRPVGEIKDQITATIKTNLTKVIISVIALQLLSSVALTLVMAPVSMVFLVDSGSIFSSLFLLLSSVVSEILLVFLLYGFFILLGRLYRQETAVIGHLFQAFRDPKRMMVITLLVCGLSILLAFATAYPGLKIIQNVRGDSIDAMVAEEIAADPEGSLLTDEELIARTAMRLYDEFVKYMPFILVPYLIIFVLIVARFSLVFPILYHEKQLTVWQAIKKATALLEGRFFSYLWCIIRCAVYPLLATVALFALTWVPADETMASLVALLFQVALYITMIVVLLAVNAYYYELADSESLCISSTTEQNVN